MVGLLTDNAFINGSASSNMILNPVFIDIIEPDSHRNNTGENNVSYSLNFYGYGFDNRHQDTSKAFGLLGNDNTYSLGNPDNSHDNSITFSRVFVNSNGMLVASFTCSIIDHSAITNHQYILNVLLVDNIP